MISTPVAPKAGALLYMIMSVVATCAHAQSAADDAWSPTASNAGGPALAGATQPRRTSTGMCTILRGGQVVDQQNCKAITTPADPARGDSAKNITYVWPSGNRTVVGGSDEDFSVNGNLAIPTTDADRGLCLRVDKTGNTFCFKEGTRVRPIAAQAPAAAPAATETAATPNAAQPARAPAAAGSPPAVPVVTPLNAAQPALAEQLAEERKLRIAAEEEIKSLKAEVARLASLEEKRSAEAADRLKTEEQKKAEEAAAKAAADKARAAAVLKELDEATAACRARDAVACDRAILLDKEAVVTGSTARGPELEALSHIARAPFGVPALSFLASVPRSTWAASAVAAFLGLTLLLVARRRPASAVPVYAHHYDDAAPPLPTLDPVGTAEPPSLDPFALEPAMSGPRHPETAITPPPLPTTPPPIPKAPIFPDSQT